MNLWLSSESAKRDYIIGTLHHRTRGRCEAVRIVSESGRPTLLSVILPPNHGDDDRRPGRNTMPITWSGKSASVEAAMKNMLAAATQEILDQWEPFDEVDYERKDRSQQELDE